MPHAAQRYPVASLMPYCTCKVPEVRRFAVCDEERLAVHALMVKRNRSEILVCKEEGTKGEDMSMGHVFNVGKVKHVSVVADLEFSLALSECGDHLRKALYISLPKDASRADSASEETRRFAIGLEHCGLCIRLVSCEIIDISQVMGTIPWSSCNILAERLQ